MATRNEAILRILADQLARVGRSHAQVTMHGDFIVVLTDADGSWEGPAPFVFGALVTCGDGAGTGHEFWARLRNVND